MSPFLRRAALACLLVLALLAGHLLQLRATGNFHVLVAGEAYRSAQPSGDALRDWTARRGLRSVVNLRGAHAGEAWYDEEVAAARALGLAHVDFAMSSGAVLGVARAAELMALLRAVPKPVLIHCKAGSDRTGLASALYLLDHGEGEARAERQISFRFGHVSLPLTAAWPIDQSWDALEDWLGLVS